MQEFKLEGKIIDIETEARVITEKFRVRQFAVVTDERYPQKIKFQLTNDRTDVLSNYKLGDVVTVHFDIKGNQNDEGKIFNNLEAWKLEGNQRAAAPATPSSADISEDPLFG